MSSFKKKKKSNETLAQQVVNYSMAMIIGFYVFTMLCVFPLFYDNKYFNMGDAKFTFFAVATIIALSLLLICFVIWIYAYRKETNYETIFKNYSITDKFVVAYFLASFFSFALSEYRIGNALTGYSGWNMGFLSQAAFVLIYLFISRFWKWSPMTLEAATVVGAITYLLGVLQRFSIDPLGMYERLSPEDIEKFLSTLGQTSWFSSYFVLIFPIGLFYYWNDQKIFSRVLAGVFTVLGFAALCTTNSDSAYVAFGFILLVFFWFSFESNEKMVRWLEILLIGLFTFRIIGFLQNCFPDRLVTLLTGTEALTSFVNHSKTMLILTIVVGVIYIGFRFMILEKDNSGKPVFDIANWKCIRKIVVYAVPICIALVVLLIILTTNGKLPDSMSQLYQIGFLNFVDSWGNHRGFNWRVAVTALSHSSFKDLIIGVGPDCFAGSMDKYCHDEVATYWHGQTLACAHNEWLNLLVTEGFLGLTTYLGIFASSIIRAGKKAYKEPAAIPFIAAVIAYMGHNFFCYQTCVSTPIIFIFMGIAEMICRNTESGEKKEGA